MGASEDGAEQTEPPQRHAAAAHDRAFRFGIGIGIGFAILSVLVVTLLAMQMKSYSACHKVDLPWEDCGRSPTEARNAGCHFEPMFGAWIPSACHVDVPKDDDHPFEDRLWFRDEALTEPISYEVLKSGNESLIYAGFFHDEHCLFAWRSLAVAVSKRLPLIDSLSNDIVHSIHCSKSIDRWIVGLQNKTLPLKILEDPKWYVTTVKLDYAKCMPLIDRYE